MKKILSIILVAILCGIAYSASAQGTPIEVSGLVVDKTTEDPLTGVSVLLNNSSKSTVTDIDGGFSIKCTPEAILIFSFVGYKTQIHIVYDVSKPILIKLEEDLENT
jgi:hypothetical protein